MAEAMSRTAARNPSGTGTTPFSPWTVSSTMAAVRSSTAALKASTSPNGTNVTSPGSGSNGSRYFGLWVSAKAPMVRPWKEPSIATSFVRPVSRVSLKAASFASVPELVKNTLVSGLPVNAASRSARRICCSLAKKLDTWPSRPSCSVIAAVTAG